MSIAGTYGSWTWSTVWKDHHHFKQRFITCPMQTLFWKVKLSAKLLLSRWNYFMTVCCLSKISYWIIVIRYNLYFDLHINRTFLTWFLCYWKQLLKITIICQKSAYFYTSNRLIVEPNCKLTDRNSAIDCHPYTNKWHNFQGDAVLMMT